MRKYIPILSVVMCCISCDTTTADQQMIVDSRTSFNQAIASHDTSALVKHWTDDIVVITSRNTRFVGKDQYAACQDVPK